MLSIKSIISQKLNIVKFSKLKLNRFSKLCIFWDKKKIHITLRIFNDHISKTKNRKKIDFSSVSEHCATLRTKNSIWPFLRIGEGEEWGYFMLLTRNNPTFLHYFFSKMKNIYCNKPHFTKEHNINKFQTDTDRHTQGTVYCKPITVF